MQVGGSVYFTAIVAVAMGVCIVESAKMHHRNVCHHRPGTKIHALDGNLSKVQAYFWGDALLPYFGA